MLMPVIDEMPIFRHAERLFRLRPAGAAAAHAARQFHALSRQRPYDYYYEADIASDSLRFDGRHLFSDGDTLSAEDER